MNYRPDLSKILVQDYQNILTNKNLLPGRRALLIDIDQSFTAIREQGVTNVAQLKKALSTPKKLSAFSNDSGISIEYLVLLKREINSLLPKTIPIQKLPNLDTDTCKSLTAFGIHTTEQLYEACRSGNLGLQPEAVKDLLTQCDLIRIDGIGPLAVKIFMEAGYDSSRSIANANAEDMLFRVQAANEKGAYYSGNLAQKDMQFCIDHAKFLLQYGS